MTPCKSIAIVALACQALIGAQAMASGNTIGAHSASALNGTATARLHLIRSEGSQLIEAGPVSGVLNGSATARVHAGAVFSGTFTIHTRAGSITGHGSATPHGTGRYQSFSGSFVAIAGRARYARVRGTGGLYGVFDRRSDSVVIQITGKLSY
jgi:hypothetical protein